MKHELPQPARSFSTVTRSTGIMLAVDAGQTGTRATLVDADRPGPVGLGPGVRYLRTPGGVGHAAEAIHAAAELAGLPRGGVGEVVVGLSGFADAAPDLERLAAELMRRLGAQRVVLASDVVSSFLGALGLGAGAVVAAGTGSVALAADGAGAVALVDGWGHLLGDAGSGFAIGRAGLASALRAVDGRGGSEALRAHAETAFGRLEELHTTIYSDAAPVRRVAAFAHAVADAARVGDETARAIWTDAAVELATTTQAAADRALGAGTPADVSWAGGLFAADELLGVPFTARLADDAPHLRVVTPAATSLDGARLLRTPEAARMFPGRIFVSEGGDEPRA